MLISYGLARSVFLFAGMRRFIEEIDRAEAAVAAEEFHRRLRLGAVHFHRCRDQQNFLFERDKFYASR